MMYLVLSSPNPIPLHAFLTEIVIALPSSCNPLHLQHSTPDASHHKVITRPNDAMPSILASTFLLVKKDNRSQTRPRCALTLAPVAFKSTRSSIGQADWRRASHTGLALG